MSRILKIAAVIALFMAVFVLTWMLYFPHSPLGKQEANLKLAQEHQPKVEASLRQITGAEDVTVAVHTVLDGSLEISGNVSDEPTAEAVIAAVLKTTPPITTQFWIMVGQTNMIQRIVPPEGHRD